MRFGVKFAKDLNFAVLGKARISRQIQLHKVTKEILIFIFVHLTINRERQQHKLVSTKNSNEKNGQKKAPKAVISRTNLPEVKISISVESSSTLNFFVVPSQSRLVAAILKWA